MSTGRDELAKLLFVTDNHNAKDADAEWEFLLQTPKYLAAYHQMADAILAAGYSKPRQVSTVEELDALLEFSVVTRNGVPYIKTARGWQLAGNGHAYPSNSLLLNNNATVLHEPGQP